ncbi:UBA-like domain-containing protein 1 isoform X1 [Pongo abelii]|uniref:UBA-like domain-containing protein 1 isoform X1 n=1 Tax=Pongo abelii TaxID=9601 RepID=UPI0023E85BC5|nr:UBA-like domain-containing protein 1 isoform X1 [Pongo abelii]
MRRPRLREEQRLATCRDSPQRLFPGDQHPLQPPPPPDDVHPCQYPCYTPQLPRRSHHVLPSQGLRELPQRWQRQPDGRDSHVTPATLPPCRHQQLCGLQLAHGGLAPGWPTAPPATAAPVDSSTPFSGFRLATPGPPTGHLRTQGPPCHGGREIREAPPPSRRPGPRGAGERTSLRAPFTPSLSAPLVPRSPGGESADSSQAGTCLVPEHAAAHMQGHGPSGPGTWSGSERPGCLADRTSETTQPSLEDVPAPPSPGVPWRTTLAETSLIPGLELLGGQQASTPTLGNAEPLRMCARGRVCVFLRVSLFRSNLVPGAAGLCMLE